MVDEGFLLEHQIKFVFQSGEDLSYGSGVGDHAAISYDIGKIPSRDIGGRLIVDSDLDFAGVVVNELDDSAVLDGF